MLITGLHTVCDIYCITCNCVLGWKYEVRAWGTGGRAGGRGTAARPGRQAAGSGLWHQPATQPLQPLAPHMIVCTAGGV